MKEICILKNSTRSSKVEKIFSRLNTFSKISTISYTAQQTKNLRMFVGTFSTSDVKEEMNRDCNGRVVGNVVESPSIMFSSQKENDVWSLKKMIVTTIRIHSKYLEVQVMPTTLNQPDLRQHIHACTKSSATIPHMRRFLTYDKIIFSAVVEDLQITSPCT